MPKLVDKEIKKGKILEAAMKIFSTKGVAKTRMTDIAEAAGIGKGTIYEYFRSKEEIFSASFYHLFEKIDQLIASRIYKVTNPEEKIRVFFNAYIEHIEEIDRESFQIMLDFWAEGIRHKDEDKIRIFDINKIYDENRKFFISIFQEGIHQGLFREDIDTFYTASVIFGAMDGLFLQWIMMEPSTFDFKEAAETLLDITINGIKK